MGSIAVSHLAWQLPGGDELFRDVGFRVGDGDRVAIVGANGVGKSTLLKLITGDLTASDGTISIDGQLGVMHQLVGTADHPATTVHELLVSIAPERLRRAAARLAAAEPLWRRPDGVRRRARRWGDAGGYDLEVTWNECVSRAFGETLDDVRDRPLRTLSGGEQKRLALETLLRSEFDILVLDEPDNFLDVPAKRWLEEQLNATRKTVLFISHDRELLAATASKIVTVEAWGAWTHGGSFCRLRRRQGTRARQTRPRPGALRRRTATARGLRQADARPGQDQRGVRAEAEGGRDEAAPLRRARTSVRPRFATSRSTSAYAGRAPASGR